MYCIVRSILSWNLSSWQTSQKFLQNFYDCWNGNSLCSMAVTAICKTSSILIHQSSKMTQRRSMCDLILICKRSLYLLLVVVALVTPVCSIQSPSEFGGNRPNLNAPSTLPADEYGHVPSTNYDGPNESVEERLAAWRQYQQVNGWKRNGKKIDNSPFDTKPCTNKLPTKF